MAAWNQILHYLIIYPVTLYSTMARIRILTFKLHIILSRIDIFSGTSISLCKAYIQPACVTLKQCWARPLLFTLQEAYATDTVLIQQHRTQRCNILWKWHSGGGGTAQIFAPLFQDSILKKFPSSRIFTGFCYVTKYNFL